MIGAALAMLFRHQPPPPALARFVDLFWYYKGYKTTHDKERLLPDGGVELVINLRENVVRLYNNEDFSLSHSLPGAVLCGPHSRYFVIDTDEQDHVLGVHFKPGGAFPFFGMPASEFRNQHLPLELLWGVSATGDLRDHLLEAATPEMKFEVLRETLLLRLAGNRHPAVSYALLEMAAVPHTRTIAQLTDSIGLSQRRFIEVFNNEVGLTPKLYCRLKRFQQAVKLVHGGCEVDWAGVAAECGYFDQSHFVHDFRAFSGMNPSAYLAARGAHLNHVPIG